MASQTQYTQSVTPAWYTNYAKDILSAQATVANRPYASYGGPRIAGFTPNQQAGMQETVGAATGYQPVLGSAIAGTAGAADRSTLGAASPWLAAASDSGATGMGYGALGQAAGLTGASTSPTGLGMAMPHLAQAGQSSADAVGQYMNPYVDNVVNRIGELGARTLNEQLMPAIQNKYIQAGQLGGPTRPGVGASGAPSGMPTDTARALRDVQEGVLKQQADALSTGYGQAMGAAQTDLARQGQLAQTAGGLGFQQQGALAQAGQQMAGIGGQYAGIGQNQQQLMGTLAGQVGQMYGQDTANQLATSGQLAQLAQQMQSQGLAGGQAITGVGAQEQSLNQANLDLAYQNFAAQQGYPQQQINQLTQTLAGVGQAIPQGSMTYQSSKTPSTGTLSQVAGLAATAAGMGAFK